MITFGELTEEDIVEVSRIEEESFSMPWKPDDFREMLTLDYAYYVVARDGEKPVGCCGVRNLCGDGEITNVVIDKSYRGRGIGEHMLTYLIETSKSLGIENYTLEVRKSNAAAIGLYEKLGFVCEGARKDFYEAPREDALIYWLRRG